MAVFTGIRTEDIPILIEHILFGIRHEEKNTKLNISNDAIELLQSYGWPGNVRQLTNIVKKAAIL
ncbi:MAG: sigma-54-dependent Fis family transcriptional regulator, partial [Anaerolineae bacterium]|nr:sigma-54-dependent Fis family transcriptional regulator [Anaerolineae bacterium]